MGPIYFKKRKYIGSLWIYRWNGCAGVLTVMALSLTVDYWTGRRYSCCFVSTSSLGEGESAVSSEKMNSPEYARSYKALTRVEQAFLSIKAIDLKVRPIHHRLEDRVRAHLLLCMLAYYIEWHIRDAWRELTFADTDQAAKVTRDPVAPAQRLEQALQKVHSRTLTDGTAARSIDTLMSEMSEMSSIVRNTCRPIGSIESALHSFNIDTSANDKQRHAFELIDTISV